MIKVYEEQLTQHYKQDAIGVTLLLCMKTLKSWYVISLHLKCKEQGVPFSLQMTPQWYL